MEGEREEGGREGGMEPEMKGKRGRGREGGRDGARDEGKERKREGEKDELLLECSFILTYKRNSSSTRAHFSSLPPMYIAVTS